MSWSRLRIDAKRATVSGGLLSLCLGMSACSSTVDERPVAVVPQGTGSAAAVPDDWSASPEPSLDARQQQAFEEATAAAVAYRQIIADLYSGTRSNLNDLNDVATGDLLDRTLMSVSKGISAGHRSVPEGVEVKLVSATPVRVQLDRKVPRVVVRACIDRTSITDVAPDGATRRGVRSVVDYHMIQTTQLPPPGWALTKLTAEEHPEDRMC